MSTENKTSKRGRPVVEGSKRQARLNAQAAKVAAGGDGMQPSGPKMNPVEAALQQQAMGLQLKQIEAQNRLTSAETAKALAEANKIAGVDTKGKELENKWQEIENRIQLSKENIAAANVTEANANAKKAAELWNQEMLNTKYLNETQEERVAKLVSEIALLQKEGSCARLNRRCKLQHCKKDTKGSGKLLLRDDNKKNVG